MKNEIVVKLYSEDFKKMVVDEMEKGTLSLRGAQRKYGIGKTETIRRWQVFYGKAVPTIKFHYTSLDKSGNVIEKEGR